VVSNWEDKDIILISDAAECALYIDSYNVEENFDTVIKFDSACSRNMSGIKDRITEEDNTILDINIRGFNGATSTVDSVGVNADGKMEYYVSSMPPNLVLLCANDYAKDGAAILLPDKGVVLQLTELEREDLTKYIERFTVLKALTVNNRTYEVDRSVVSAYLSNEEAMNNTATRYFNTKVNVSNQEERILAMLLTGLSFNDLYVMAKQDNVHGLPRDLTIKSLNQFSHRYGTTPDILQLARPNLAGNTKGYMAQKSPLTEVGERVEADYMFTDFNMVAPNNNKTVKIPTLGGAIAAYLTVDCYSGYIHGSLVKSVANSVDRVRETVQEYGTDGKKIMTFAADCGVIIQSEYRVMLPAVQQYLLAEHIHPEVGVPYQHDQGNQHIERSIRAVKELILFAVLYVLNNPNFDKFGFTKHEIFQLWGELFNWAVQIQNLKICPNNDIATKYEIYHGVKPDLRTIRILPIFSVLYVLRETKKNTPVPTNKSYWKRGLYTGPSKVVPGAIRVAIKTQKRIKIITTTIFKGVSDGGDIQPYQIVNHYLAQQHQTPAIAEDLAVTEDEGIGAAQPDPADPEEEPSNDSVDDSAAPQTDHQPASDTVADVLAILEHKGTAKKKSKMKFKIRWKGFDDSHDSWLPWKELQHNWVLHNYLREKDMSHLIPLIHRSEPVIQASRDSELIIAETMPESESRGDSNAQKEQKQGEELRIAISNPLQKHTQHATQRDKLKMMQQVMKWGSRAERMENRKKKEQQLSNYSAEQFMDAMRAEMNNYRSEEQSYFADWSNHSTESIYFSFTENAYITIEQDLTLEIEPMEEGFRAVTEGVPKNFEHALRDPVWGQAARDEFLTVSDGTGTLVDCNKEVARENIRNGAQVLRLIAVYEEKVRDGVIVKKVRLVADGRTHHIHGPTYSSTPNREECMILLHIFATLDWDYYVMDEKRAFLTANRQDKRPMYATLSGVNKVFEVKKALYGTKDACRDYRIKVEELYIDKLECQKLQLCSCIFIKRYKEDVIYILSHVDDFIMGGSNKQLTEQFISEVRARASYTEPELNASRFLGLELSRDREKRIIKITMTAKIEELANKYPHAVRKKRNVPMPTTGYIVREHEIQNMSEKKQRLLNSEEITDYMAIVGSLIWIQGVRLDILFAVLYLTWFTKCPRQHHMDMAEYLIGYLMTTKDMPLVLGGDAELEPIVDADASHGTGPHSRSISSENARLNERSGAVSAKSRAQASVKLSSFESELDGTTTAIKTARRITNVLDELNLPHKQARLRQDNQAMINFVKGNATAKGVRHMELRMWYTREEYQKGNVSMEHHAGISLSADKQTKLGNVKDHRIFTCSVQGLPLLEFDYFAQFHDEEEQF